MDVQFIAKLIEAGGLPLLVGVILFSVFKIVLPVINRIEERLRNIENNIMAIVTANEVMIKHNESIMERLLGMLERRK